MQELIRIHKCSKLIIDESSNLSRNKMSLRKLFSNDSNAIEQSIHFFKLLECLQLFGNKLIYKWFIFLQNIFFIIIPQ